MGFMVILAGSGNFFTSKVGLSYSDLVARETLEAKRKRAAEVMDRLEHSTTVAAVRYQHVMADRDAAIARELNRLIEGT